MPFLSLMKRLWSEQRLVFKKDKQWTDVFQGLTPSHQAAGFLSTVLFKWAPFPTPVSGSRGNELGFHGAAYQSVPQVQRSYEHFSWNINGPARTEKLWCQRFQLKCPVSVQPRWRTAQWGKEVRLGGGGVQMAWFGLNVRAWPVNCEIEWKRLNLHKRGFSLLSDNWLVISTKDEL